MRRLERMRERVGGMRGEEDVLEDDLRDKSCRDGSCSLLYSDTILKDSYGMLYKF